MCVDDTIQILKGKRKNAEKRKEKSRDAARSRRSKEAVVFAELSNLMPVSPTTVATLDKASMMRLCISYLKLRLLSAQLKDQIASAKDSQFTQFMGSLNGFLVAVDKEGDLIYVSENVMKHLGISQIDLIGQNIYEYSHPCDHEEIKDLLCEKRDHGQEETIFARLKCTLTSKGRNVNLKSATYKVIRFRGHHLTEESPDCWVLIGETIPHPAHIDVPLDSYSFLTRHSMDMKFSYCDERVEDLLGYKPNRLIDTNLYELHHALDGEYMDRAYKHLFSKGQVWTDSYRFLASGGGYAWVETQATVVYNHKTDKPECVVCVHYVISGIEEAECVMSAVQMSSMKTESDEVEVTEEPVLSMDAIFMPKTEEMDGGGVCAPKRKLQETDTEMSDFASTAEDVSCVGQDGAMITLLSDMLLQEAGMSDMDEKKGFSFSLTEDATELDDSKSLHTPNLEQLADGECVDSGELRGKTMLYNLGVEDIDMCMRAPYIPMSGDDDLIFSTVPPVPLIDECDDGPIHMLGITESVFNPKQEDPDSDKKFQIPMSQLRQESMQLKEKKYKEMEHAKVTMKQRHPVETNRLETGPPAKKICTLDVDSDLDDSPSPLSIDISNIRCPDVDINSIEGSGVLKNLLLSGQDTAFGYRLKNINKKFQESKKIPENCVLRELLTGPLDNKNNSGNDSTLVCRPTRPEGSQQNSNRLLHQPVIVSSKVVDPSKPPVTTKITIKAVTRPSSPRVVSDDLYQQILASFQQAKNT